MNPEFEDNYCSKVFREKKFLISPYILESHWNYRGHLIYIMMIVHGKN